MDEQKQSKRKETIERMKNPLFIAACAGFIYTAYTKLALQYGWASLDQGTFQLFVDLVAYALIGTGVYSTFGAKKS